MVPAMERLPSFFAFPTRDGCGQRPQKTKAPAKKPGQMFQLFWDIFKNACHKFSKLFPILQQHCDYLEELNYCNLSYSQFLFY